MPPPSSKRTVDEAGQIITAVEVERKMLQLSNELEDLTTVLAQQAEAAARAEVAWKKERALTRLRERAMGGTGPGGRATEAEVEDIAIEKHSDLLLEHRLSEGRFDATRDAMKVKQSQVDALRTIAANLRAVT